MRSGLTWKGDTMLLWLLMLPLGVATAALLVEAVARSAGLAGESRPVWFLAIGTVALHAVILGAIHGLVVMHGWDWRGAFGLFSASGRERLMRGLLWTLPAMAVAWLLHTASGWALERLNVEHAEQAAVEALRHTAATWERLLLGLVAVGTAPVAEEALFRGVLWPWVRDRGWRVTGCLGVSLLFALTHANLAALLPLCFLSLFWIWLYETTGDLSVPIVSHALFNAVNLGWVLLSDPNSLA